MNDAEWRSDLRYFQQLIHSKYSNLFYNLTAQQFDNAVAGIDKKIGHLTDVQMNVEFAKLVAMFKVGHTAVRQRAGTGNDLTPWVHPVPVRFYLFSDGLYIKSIDAKYKEAAGGKVIKIGNTDAATALEKIRPAIAFENEQGFKNMIQFYLNLPEFLEAVGIIDDPGKVSITYLKEGKENSVTLLAENMPAPAGHGPASAANSWVDAYERKANIPLWLKEPGKLRYFEYLPESKTVYVKHSAVQDEPGETIADFFAKVFRFVDSNDVDKFILDIRLNGGGNNYLNKSVITGIIQAKKINRKGHLFIITGKATFSAAQNLTNELEKYSEAIFVGEPTSENVNFFGDTRTEILPNSKLNVNLSWLWWQNLDPRDKRQWTAPQLAADLSFEDYQKGIDPAMEVIKNYKPEGSIDEKLRNLVVAGKYDEAVAAARAYLENPLHRYYKNDLETKVNDFGYRLMNQNKFQEANKVLYMNVQLFPESANVYDSYAESWWKLGNKEEAVKYYKIAISKDPNGFTGDGARNMLKQLQEDKKGF
ncbi:MAG: hypothetical protein H7Y01_15710 [Ferruginibacter sp.]|nr:hypothetical protein [Chitinophagaceae bacterium]